MDTLARLTAGAPASALLLATILVISLLGLYKVPVLIERNLLRPYGLVERGEYATLVTSGFIHADLAHLLFNSFTFWAFGFGLERAIGTPRFAALYAIGLLGSSLATWLIHRRQPGYASLGASGARALRKKVSWKPKSRSPSTEERLPVTYHHSVRNAGCGP